MSAVPKADTFAAIYCATRGIDPADYQRAVFREVLYVHARPLAPVVLWFNRRHFIADYEFVEDVGHIRSVADFSLPMGSYIEHPDNHGFLRRRLRVRVSARRMLALVRKVLGSPGAGPHLSRNTLKPFPGA